MGDINAFGRTTEERFWAKVDRSGGSEACWPWLGARTSGGYGQLTVDRQGKMATRMSYDMSNAVALTGDQDACHTCDNPPCVNPGHLFAAPHAVNGADMRAKGRSAAGIVHWNARFTDDQVRDIRRRYAAGGVTQQQLAEEFGVGRRAIGRVLDGSRWSHVA